MERLKPFSQILEPDPRMPLRAMVNRESGESRPRQIQDHYDQVAVVTLSESVPEEVWNAFVTAQHIAIYSWFAYALVPAAMFQTFAALELALKVRMKGKKSRGRAV